MVRGGDQQHCDKTDLVLGDVTDLVLGGTSGDKEDLELELGGTSGDKGDLELANEGVLELGNEGDLELDDQGDLEPILSHSSIITMGFKLSTLTSALGIWAGLHSVPSHSISIPTGMDTGIGSHTRALHPCWVSTL